jgi:hypothetical protein
MFNEILMDNPEVVRLKLTIDSFKKYDNERKEYISNLEFRIGQLESYIEELEDDRDIQSLIEKNKIKDEQIKILNKKIRFSKIDEDTKLILETVSKDCLLNEIKGLKRALTTVRSSNEKLWSIIAKYRNKFGEL